MAILENRVVCSECATLYKYALINKSHDDRATDMVLQYQ